MYRLPADFDGSFFIGRRLEGLVFRQYLIALHFDADVSISLESSYSHQHAGSGEEAKVQEIPVTESDLMSLLGKLVSDVRHDDKGTLTLVFENGDTLSCYDPSEMYEVYQIQHDGKILIV